MFNDLFTLNTDIYDNYNESTEDILNMVIEESDSCCPDKKFNLLNEEIPEAPSGKPYDATSIKKGNGTKIKENEYNKALTDLQKSFKEGYEVLDILKNARIR